MSLYRFLEESLDPEHFGRLESAELLPSAYGQRVRFPLVEGEWHSVEYHVATPIPEWDGRAWYARFEENARVGPEGVEWIVPPQETLILIPSNRPGR